MGCGIYRDEKNSLAALRHKVSRIDNHYTNTIPARRERRTYRRKILTLPRRQYSNDVF